MQLVFKTFSPPKHCYPLRLGGVMTQKTTISPPCKPQILHIFLCSVGYNDGLRAGYLGFGSRQGQNVSLLSSAQAGSGAHPASYPVGTGSFFPPVVKWPGREADHLRPPNSEMKNGGAVPPLPHVVIA
jgi:hypothetical protein